MCCIGCGCCSSSRLGELFKKNRGRADTIIHILVNLISRLAVLLEPFMPSLTEKINTQLNQAVYRSSLAGSVHTFDLRIPGGHVIGEPAPLFRKIEDKEVADLRGRFSGKIEKDENFGNLVNGCMFLVALR